MYNYINYLFESSTFVEQFVVSFLYFLLLYFGLGGAFLVLAKALQKVMITERIEHTEVTQNQQNFEIKHSLLSIFIFGFSLSPIAYGYRWGVIEFLPHSIAQTILGLVVLFFWNEFHFFMVHRLMHVPFFMRRVHYIHHRSKIPTVWSVFSFHWLEASLLSTVPLTYLLLFPTTALAVVLFPILSILLNLAGHSNYRFRNWPITGISAFATTHNLHHTKNQENYGFALRIFDRIYNMITK